MTGPLQGPDRFHHRHQFHAVVGCPSGRAGKFLFRFPIPQNCSPTAGSGIWRTRPVGENLNLCRISDGRDGHEGAHNFGFRFRVFARSDVGDQGLGMRHSRLRTGQEWKPGLRCPRHFYERFLHGDSTTQRRHLNAARRPLTSEITRKVTAACGSAVQWPARWASPGPASDWLWESRPWPWPDGRRHSPDC
jgi:hypothetical protein